MHKTNCMQSIENIQYGKYLVAYVLKHYIFIVLEGRVTLSNVACVPV